MRGKPWSVDEERQLRQLVDEGQGTERISQIMGKSRVSVRAKLYNLGLFLKDATVGTPNLVAAASAAATSLVKDVEVASKKSGDNGGCGFVLKASGPLPSVEEKLRVLDAALVALEQPGLRTGEVSRLNKIIQGVKVYQLLFADFVNYRDLEIEVLELRKQLAFEKNKS